MTLNKGDIVLLPFPFTDLRTIKVRPAVVLWVDTTGYDVTSCFISSQNVTILNPEEFLLDPSDSDFQITGLRIASKVRVTRVVTVERGLITKRIGKLSDTYIQQLNTVLQQALQLV